MPPTELVVVVDAADVLAAFAALIVLVSVAFLGGVFAAKPHEDSRPSVDAVESARTVELPRGHAGGPRTGTLHRPQYQRHGADNDATVIERVQR